ncbi:hypothetical protein [Desulfitibacter alkalitolerans]|uniref:hypothetical protein n=1 Tax=Desulfitibacter alkalitolerans TaxID=264641 RepID=UPI00048831CD|nr:hypothetical protein [Desulfitibacter alkalitolerans]
MKATKIIIVVLLILCLSSTLLVASEVISESEVTFKREMDSGVIYGIEATQQYLIEEWRARIRDLGNGVVEIYGYTYTNQTANYIDVDVILQRKVNGTWVDIHSQKWYSHYTNKVSGAKSVSVAKGSEYRVRTVHKATTNTIQDTTTAVTGALFIN